MTRPLFRTPLAWLFLISTGLIPSFGHAQAPLTWQACIDALMLNNSELKAGLSTYESVELQEGIARAGFLPQISGSLGITRGNSSSSTSPSTTDTAALTASQNLFSGFQDVGKREQARANTVIAAQTLRSLKAKLSSDLKAAFQSLSYAKEDVTLSQATLLRREENLRLVTLRFESGRENKGSVLLSQAYLNQSHYDQLQAQNAVRIARAQLARILGLDDAARADIQGQVPTHEPPALLPSWGEIAQQTPSIQQAIAQSQSSEASVTIARAQFLPNLNVSSTLDRQDTQFFPRGANRWSVGMTLSLPLLNGGKDLASLRSNFAQRSAAEGQLDNSGRLVIAQLEQSYASYLESVSKLKVDQSFQEAALVRAEIARQRYNNGLMTFEDWDVIENDLITRQKNYLQSKKDRVIAEAAWEQAQGQGVIP